jgi:hypothetical protein
MCVEASFRENGVCPTPVAARGSLRRYRDTLHESMH